MPNEIWMAQTGLEAANTALLDQLGTDQNVLFIAASETIRNLFQAAVARVEPYEQELRIDNGMNIWVENQRCCMTRLGKLRAEKNRSPDL